MVYSGYLSKRDSGLLTWISTKFLKSGILSAFIHFINILKYTCTNDIKNSQTSTIIKYSFEFCKKYILHLGKRVSDPNSQFPIIIK